MPRAVRALVDWLRSDSPTGFRVLNTNLLGEKGERRELLNKLVNEAVVLCSAVDLSNVEGGDSARDHLIDALNAAGMILSACDAHGICPEERKRLQKPERTVDPRLHTVAALAQNAAVAVRRRFHGRALIMPQYAVSYYLGVDFERPAHQPVPFSFFEAETDFMKANIRGIEAFRRAVQALDPLLRDERPSAPDLVEHFEEATAAIVEAGQWMWWLTLKVRPDDFLSQVRLWFAAIELDGEVYWGPNAGDQGWSQCLDLLLFGKLGELGWYFSSFIDFKRQYLLPEEQEFVAQHRNREGLLFWLFHDVLQVRRSSDRPDVSQLQQPMVSAFTRLLNELAKTTVIHWLLIKYFIISKGAGFAYEDGTTLEPVGEPVEGDVRVMADANLAFDMLSTTVFQQLGTTVLPHRVHQATASERGTGGGDLARFLQLTNARAFNWRLRWLRRELGMPFDLTPPTIEGF